MTLAPRPHRELVQGLAWGGEVLTPAWSELAPGLRALTLRNAYLEVTVLPDKGADIYALVHRESGVDVLFKSPWGLRSPGPWPRAEGSMGRWLEAYPGGWQLLLPNGGDVTPPTQ